MPVNGLKAADYQHKPNDPRKQNLDNLKGLFKALGKDLPDRIKQEYSDILTD